MTTLNAFDCVIVDSAGWLEYISADTKSELFKPFFLGERPLLVPVIVLYEVRKILLLRQTKNIADYFVSEALRHSIVAIDEEIALSAAAVSIQYKLSMGDAILFATAERRNAEFVTSDSHFKGLPGVTLV